MALLSAEELEVQYGGRKIFDGESMAVEPGDRLGIVGANGTGKSTLLKILAGELVPDSGRVTRAKGVRIGYLPQEHSDPGEGLLLDTVLAAAPGREQLETRITELERELASSEDTTEQMALSQALADVHAELTEIDGRWAPHLAQSILHGLGFTQADHSRPLRALSGGWRMRAALAALLFGSPDVVLLDEPTNHLDVPTVHWLSGFLRSYRPALILTCHDREFLNGHIDKVVSLELDGLRSFRGNYDDYLVQREIELEHLENRVKRDEQRKKELEAFVDRFRAKATKARQAQSKAKLIEKLEAEQVKLPNIRRPVVISFDPVARAGERVLDVRKLTFGWDGGEPLFADLDIEVLRGDRIAIVGVNGAGKTTLLRLVAGDVAPDAGTIELGHKVSASYFAQHQAEVLNQQATVLEEVWSVAPAMSQTRARTICGAFLFSGDEVDKRVGVLSGGEKTRVALAKMLTAPGNLLLLDEPTNHLDTESADKLTQSLEAYDGTLVFVSHNLDFARRLSNKVWNVHDGIVEVYPGSLADYLRHLSEQMDEDDPAVLLSAPGAKPGPTGGSDDKVAKKAARAGARKARAAYSRRRGALERELAILEAKVSDLESEQAELLAALVLPETHDDRFSARKLAERYEAVKLEVEAALEAWTRKQEALDQLIEPE